MSSVGCLQLKILNLYRVMRSLMKVGRQVHLIVYLGVSMMRTGMNGILVMELVQVEEAAAIEV